LTSTHREQPDGFFIPVTRSQLDFTSFGAGFGSCFASEKSKDSHRSQNKLASLVETALNQSLSPRSKERGPVEGFSCEL
jgi:hypothetical protein